MPQRLCCGIMHLQSRWVKLCVSGVQDHGSHVPDFKDFCCNVSTLPISHGLNWCKSSAACRDVCLSSCQIRCCGLSCAMPSTWSTRLRCRVTEVCLRRTWCSWLRRLSAVPATTPTTTAAWPWPGRSLTGSAAHSVSYHFCHISLHLNHYRGSPPFAFLKIPTGWFQ